MSDDQPRGEHATERDRASTIIKGSVRQHGGSNDRWRVTQRGIKAKQNEVGCYYAIYALGSTTHGPVFCDKISATIRPYKPKASAKMRIRIMGT